MKYWTFSIILILFVSFYDLSAQNQLPIGKGSVKISGTASFTSRGHDLLGKNRVKTLTINPTLSHFILSHFALCGDFILTSQWVEDTYSDSKIGIGPAIAFYFGDQKAKSYPFVSIGIILIRGWNSGDIYNENNLRFSSGMDIMISRDVAITSKIYYQIEDVRGHDVLRDGNKFGFELGIAAFLF